MLRSIINTIFAGHEWLRQCWKRGSVLTKQRVRRGYETARQQIEAIFETLIRTRRRILASLAGADLTFNVAATLDPILLSDGLGLLIDNAVVVIVVSLLRSAPSILGTAGTVAYFGLYAYVLYTLVPQRLKNLAVDGRERQILVLLATGAVFGTFVGLSFDGIPGPVTLAIPIGASLALVGYFWLADDDPFAGPDGRLYRLSRTMTDGEERPQEGFTTRPSASGRLPSLARATAITAMTLVLGVLFTLFGFLAFTVGLFFPLLEFTVLGWIIVDRFTAQTNLVPHVSTRRPKVEESIFTVVNAAFSNPLKGIPAAMMLLIGVFLSAFPFLMVVSVVILLSPSDLLSLAGTAGRAFGGIMTIASLLAYSCYGLWYWWRTSLRLPAFLREQAGEETSTDVARPIWTTTPLVPVLFVPALGSMIAALYLHTGDGSNEWPVWLTVTIGVVQLCAVLVAVWAYRRTRTMKAQSVASENWALPLGFCIQSAGTVGALSILSSYESIKEGGFAGLEWSNPLNFGMAESMTIIMLVIFFYALEFTEYCTDQKGLIGGGLIFVGMLLLIAVVFVPLASIYPPLIQYAIIAVLLGLGIVQAVIVARE